MTFLSSIQRLQNKNERPGLPLGALCERLARSLNWVVVVAPPGVFGTQSPAIHTVAARANHATRRLDTALRTGGPEEPSTALTPTEDISHHTYLPCTGPHLLDTNESFQASLKQI